MTRMNRIVPWQMVHCLHPSSFILMKAEILSIGSELTSGQNLDTNSQWLSLRLAEIGIPVGWHTTIADDLRRQHRRLPHRQCAGPARPRHRRPGPDAGRSDARGPRQGRRRRAGFRRTLVRAHQADVRPPQSPDARAQSRAGVFSRRRRDRSESQRHRPGHLDADWPVAAKGERDERSGNLSILSPTRPDRHAACPPKCSRCSRSR